MKAELRRELRARRASLPVSQRHMAAVLAAAHFARLCPRVTRVALYLEQGSELGTHPLLDWLLEHGIETYVPRLRGNGGMHFVRIQRHTLLRRNRYGILEPTGRCQRLGARRMDVIVLPLSGFDARGHRLGSGGGYYDRALAFPRPAQRPLYVGYAYALQRVQTLPVEPWDVRLDAVITENGVWRWLIG